MAKRSPLVGIIMGSQSDWVTLRHAAATLDALGVAYEARIVSPHRTPPTPRRRAGAAGGASV
jgi:5-(carboxyamino)imidazole ribonucleotide mutase